VTATLGPLDGGKTSGVALVVAGLRTARRAAAATGDVLGAAETALLDATLTDLAEQYAAQMSSSWRAPAPPYVEGCDCPPGGDGCDACWRAWQHHIARSTSQDTAR
jgi:hypothetical protein